MIAFVHATLLTTLTLLTSITIFFGDEAHQIFVDTLPDGQTSLLDHVYGQPLPFVISNTAAIDADPSAATDSEVLVVVWEATYPNAPAILRYAYTYDGRIWRDYPLPIADISTGAHSPRLSESGSGVFALRFFYTGDCREHLAYLDFRYGAPRWSLPIIGECRVRLPTVFAESWPPPRPKPAQEERQ